MNVALVAACAAVAVFFLIFHLSYLASCIAEKHEVSIDLSTCAACIVASCVGIIVGQAVV